MRSHPDGAQAAVRVGELHVVLDKVALALADAGKMQAGLIERLWLPFNFFAPRAAAGQLLFGAAENRQHPATGIGPFLAVRFLAEHNELVADIIHQPLVFLLIFLEKLLFLFALGDVAHHLDDGRAVLAVHETRCRHFKNPSVRCARQIADQFFLLQGLAHMGSAPRMMAVL